MKISAEKRLKVMSFKSFWGFKAFRRFCRTSCMDSYCVYSVVLYFLKQVLQSFRRMLQGRFAVKLQKCFVDYKPSPDFDISA